MQDVKSKRIWPFSIWNEVKKLVYVQFFTNLIILCLILILPKCTSSAVFVKRLLFFLTKINVYWQPILK